MARQPAQQQQWTRESEQAALARLRTAKPLVLVYTRQSKTDFNPDGTPKGPSLQQQLADCLRLREIAGLPYEHFEDADKSGKETSKRPGYLAMMERIRTAPAGAIGAVVCYNQDRPHRNDREMLDFMAEVEERRILVFDINGLVSGVNKLPWKVMAAVAQDMREKLSQRVKDNLRYLREQGRLLGHGPMGYRRVNGGLELDPEAAPLVRQVFTLYATGKFSLVALARHLDEAGVPVPKNRDYPKLTTTWNRSLLMHMLQNPSYMGVVRVGGEVRGSPSHPVRKGGDLIPGTHPALIDEALYERCQQVRELHKRRRTVYRHHRNTYPLQPLLTCGRCGGLMHGRRRPELGRHWYRCANRPSGQCDLPWIPGDILEESVAFDLRRYVGSGPPDNRFVARLGAGLAKAADPLAQARKTLKALDERERRVNDMYERSTIDRDEHLRRMGLINLERQAARQQSQESLASDIRWAGERLATVLQMWSSADPEQRGIMVSEIYAGLEVDRTNFGIEVVATPTKRWTPLLRQVMRLRHEVGEGKHMRSAFSAVGVAGNLVAPQELLC